LRFLSFANVIRTVTDGEREECVDPGEKGAILETGEVEGPGPPGRAKTDSWHQTVEEVRCYKMSESTGDRLVTTSSHVYAQSMYHMYICVSIHCG
jgi:hypothetical protein